MNGGTIAVIPIRSLSSGKTRLASVLSAHERHSLVKSMLMRVARAAFGSDMISRAIVVSTDPEALDFAKSLDARVVPALQGAAAGLLPALDQARDVAIALGAEAILVLFGDLPLIDTADVRALLRPSASIVIAPDRRGAGTNALALRGAALRPFVFQFGVDSHRRHQAEAVRLGIDTDTIRSPGVLFDLDTPDDWRVLGHSPASIACGEFANAFLQEAAPR